MRNRQSSREPGEAHSKQRGKQGSRALRWECLLKRRRKPVFLGGGKREEWWRMRSERRTGVKFYRVKHFDFILRAMESRGKILGREIR